MLICRNAEGVHLKRKFGNPWFNPYREMDKTCSPSYSSSQITYVEAEAVEFSHCRFRFHRKRTASTASASSFCFRIPGKHSVILFIPYCSLETHLMTFIAASLKLSPHTLAHDYSEPCAIFSRGSTYDSDTCFDNEIERKIHIIPSRWLPRALE